MRRKRQKVLIIGGLLLLAVLAAVLIFVKQKAKELEESESRKDTLLALTADQIIAVEYTSPNGAVSLIRDEGQWHFLPDRETEADQTKAGELAASLTGVRLYQTMNGVSDLSQYGLETPRAEVRITDKEGAVTSIAVGDENETTSTVYCTLNDDPGTVYAASVSLTTNLFSPKEEYVLKPDSEVS